MHVVSETRLQGATSEIGDRKTQSTYELIVDDDDYRLLSESETKLHQTALGTWTMFAKTGKSYDPSFRAPVTEEVWVNAVDTDRIISRRQYDMTTGNVVKVWKPVQWAALQDENMNLNRTTLDYDARKLFPIKETNELGHVRDFEYEYGTGTKLVTLGPNVPACAVPVPHTCGSEPLKEEHKIKIDGLGRMIERYEAFGNDGTIYRRHKVEMNTYVDGPWPTTGASITHEAAIDYNESTLDIRYTKEKTELDGNGRTTKVTVDKKGVAAADHVTQYLYTNSGFLQEVRVPDPTANDTSQVTYRYGFDSLGRATSIRRPDNVTPTLQSGVDIEYNGLTQTTTEFVGADGGERAKTETTKDAFGRVFRVKEECEAPDPCPTGWATTTYGFAPDDSIKLITDAQGASTDLVHDFAGRRTSITRADKTWSYTYDKNGNVKTQTSPCSPMPSCALSLQYTTQIIYDVLDRPESKANAPGDLSEADKTLFGSHTESFTYDGGTNGKGRLMEWMSFPPSGGTLTMKVTPSYNVQGQETYLVQNTNAAGYTNLTRSSYQIFNLAGNVTGTYRYEIVGTQNCQNGSYSEHHYDARGFPNDVQIVSCLYAPNPEYSWMVNARNVAGLVTRRFSQAAFGPYTPAESNWTYDKLGRVKSQTITKGTSNAQVAKQVVRYFGNDNPSGLDHWLGATNLRTYSYLYDRRHQLKNVTTSGSVFTGTYKFGQAGRFTSANIAASALPNGDVTVRNVNYVYSASDPEQVTALKKVSNGQDFATYTYDLAGNQLTRIYPASGQNTQRWDYVYDGNNRLRRATKKIGNNVQGSEEYWYDQNGTRTLVVKRDATGSKTGMIWFMREAEVHYNATGTVTRAFSHVSLGTPVFRLDRSTDGPAIAEYQFHGVAGNTLAAIDQATSTINASFNYGPYGEIVEATSFNATVGLPWHRRRMNDKFVDDITGNAYYGFRYYDKVAMGWTQSDPLYRFAPDAAGNPRRANLYQFSLSNPLRYIDPDGRDAFGAHKFFSEARADSLAGAGNAIEGGGWGPIAGAGETFSTGLREYRKAWGQQNLACGGCLGEAAHDAQAKRSGPPPMRLDEHPSPDTRGVDWDAVEDFAVSKAAGPFFSTLFESTDAGSCSTMTCQESRRKDRLEREKHGAAGAGDGDPPPDFGDPPDVPGKRQRSRSKKSGPEGKCSGNCSRRKDGKLGKKPKTPTYGYKVYRAIDGKYYCSECWPHWWPGVPMPPTRW